MAQRENLLQYCTAEQAESIIYEVAREFGLSEGMAYDLLTGMAYNRYTSEAIRSWYCQHYEDEDND